MTGVVGEWLTNIIDQRDEDTVRRTLVKTSSVWITKRKLRSVKKDGSWAVPEG